eukprot:185430_1
MEKQLTARRYEGNADWSFEPNQASLRPSASKHRTKSSRSLRIPTHSGQRSSEISTTMKALTEDKEQEPDELQIIQDINQSMDNKNMTTNEKMEFMLVRMKESLTDQWRRATQSGNDPYVTVSLKPDDPPDPDDEEPMPPMYFSTLPILGGGSDVEFHPEYDAT